MNHFKNNLKINFYEKLTSVSLFEAKHAHIVKSCNEGEKNGSGKQNDLLLSRNRKTGAW